MTEVIINDHKLENIKMKMQRFNKYTISHLSYSKQKFKIKLRKNRLSLKLPPFLILELYYSGIIPQNKEEVFSVKVNNQKIGFYRITEITYPDIYERERLISMKLKNIYEDLEWKYNSPKEINKLELSNTRKQKGQNVKPDEFRIISAEELCDDCIYVCNHNKCPIAQNKEYIDSCEYYTKIKSPISIMKSLDYFH